MEGNITSSLDLSNIHRRLYNVDPTAHGRPWMRESTEYYESHFTLHTTRYKLLQRNVRRDKKFNIMSGIFLQLCLLKKNKWQVQIFQNYTRNLRTHAHTIIEEFSSKIKQIHFWFQNQTNILLRKTGFFDGIYTHVYGKTKFRLKKKTYLRELSGAKFHSVTIALM